MIRNTGSIRARNKPCARSQKINAESEADPPMNNVPKYKRHSQMQTKRILSAAQRLFIENGIESVTLTQIAEASGVTRATLYKYFRSKERILWEIHHLRMLEYGEQLRVQLSAPWQTTYDRFSLFFNFLYQEFSERTDTFLFLRVFDSIYQRETAKEAHGIYETVFHPQDFGTGTTVRLLANHFHDGSVRPDLEPISTCATMMYSALAILSFFAKDSRFLSAKYGADANLMVRTALDSLLHGIAAQPPAAAEEKEEAARRG